MLNFKRRSVVVGSLAALLLLTGILQYRYSQSLTASAPRSTGSPAVTAEPGTAETPAAADTAAADTAVSSDFFPGYKLERQSTREEEAAYLQAIIDDENTDPATRRTAQEQLMTLASTMEKELLMEGLLEAKGFAQVITTLHTDSVNVVVGSPMLSEAQVAQIYDVVLSQADASPENIRIITAVSRDETAGADGAAQ